MYARCGKSVKVRKVGKVRIEKSRLKFNCSHPLSAAGEERVNDPPEAEMFG
jgi:hypothetical protein